MRRCVFSRGSSAAVWTGSEILVFGFARSGAQSYRLGYRYDPATDVWTPMANDLFTPDCHGFDPSAVWTGTTMFYVGAEHFTDDTHWCKGSYVPATDTWGPMGNNAPDSWAASGRAWSGRGARCCCSGDSVPTISWKPPRTTCCATPVGPGL
jgi:hypothetical protein